MNAPADPDQVVALSGITLLVLVGIWRLILWVRAAAPGPEPWSADIEASVHAADATPVCHRCLNPHSDGAWFCEHCGSAVGHYNNLMPYVDVFSQGEVFRNGTTDTFRARPLIVAGYLLISLSSYFFLAPIYWFFLFRNLSRLKQKRANEPEANRP